jgi:hypothetical protein
MSARGHSCAREYIEARLVGKPLPVDPAENLRGRGHPERQGCAREAEFHRREHHSHNAAANRYIVEIMKGALSQNQKIDVALAYRLMRDASL